MVEEDDNHDNAFCHAMTVGDSSTGQRMVI
jgi:hypothetical protein